MNTTKGKNAKLTELEKRIDEYRNFNKKLERKKLENIKKNMSEQTL